MKYLNRSQEMKQLNYFQDEFKVDMHYYNEDEIQYSNFENDNYKVIGEIASYGGEGKGEERWNISKVTDKRTNEVFFIKFDGFYTSWDGPDWSENYWYSVEPKIIDVIKWF